MESESVTVRDATPGDYKGILELNEADVAVLSPLDGEALARMAACAELFQVAEADGEVAAFLVAMREGSGYWSDNYRWFEERYQRFLYVDRIVVGGRFRGLGIARTLYGGVIGHARRTDVPCVTAEIDVEPVYSEASMRFHASMGFSEIGRKPYGEAVTVSLQKLDLSESEDGDNREPHEQSGPLGS